MKKVDTTLLIKRNEKDLLIIQIYMDAITFGANKIFYVKNLPT